MTEKENNYTPEQEGIINYGKGNILVSASAGSGKTYTMIERIKRLIIEEKVPVINILAVTFTNASAQDMRDKLKEALMKKVDEIETDAKWLAKQIADVSSADISTIHTLCARFIRQYFFMCDVLPDFEIMDEEKSAIIMNECVNQVFEEVYRENSPEMKPFLNRFYKKNDAELKGFVISVYSYISGRTDGEEFLEKYREIDTEEYLNKRLKEEKDSLISKISDAREKILDISDLIENCEKDGIRKFKDEFLAYIDLLEKTDIYQIKGLLKAKPRRDMGRNLCESDKEIKEDLVDISDIIYDAMNDIKAIHTTPEEDKNYYIQDRENNECMVKLVRRFTELYREYKKDENVLDFNDLERNALAILRDDDTAEEIRNKYQYVFVDECQDINSLQNELISRLSHNNLFMVGDNKQSIYGFRGTSPEFFTEKARQMKINGEKVERLNYNYRSAGAIIDNVNKIFDFCMTDKYFGENYADTSRLEEGNIYPKEAYGRWEVHHFIDDADDNEQENNDDEREEPRIYDILEEINKSEIKDKSDVSSLVTKIIDDELKKDYYDIKTKTYKNVTYGDICILSRSTKADKIKDIIQKLRLHGVPVESNVKLDIRSFPEIIMMINVIKLVDCFYNDVPLVSTLKSPLGNVTDEELMEIVRFYYENKKRKASDFSTAFSYFSDNAEKKSNTYPEEEKASILSLYNKLKDFVSYFNNLRYLSDFIGSFGVIDKVINDFNIESYLLSGKLGKSKVQRLTRFLYASVVGEKKLTIREFLYKINNCPKAFEFADDSEEDCVKVMTMHSSKGLEFPVVLIVRLESKFNTLDLKSKVMIDKNIGIHFKYFDSQLKSVKKTWITKKLEEEYLSQMEREEMRIFYVATTRAKYSMHLIYSGNNINRTDKFQGAKRLIDYVPLTMETTEHKPSDFEFIDQKIKTRKVLLGQVDSKISEKIQDNLKFSYGYSGDTMLPLKSNVTASVKTDEGQENLVHVLFDEPSPDTERGTIAHKIMECFDFNHIELFDKQIETIIENNILTKEQVEKINLTRIKNAISSGIFDDLKGYKLYREKQFLVNVPASMIMDTESQETVLLQGVIDLLVVGSDDAVIIDYKYSSLDSNSLKIKYKKQLDLYAYAVNKVLNKKIKRKTLINIFTGDVVNVD